MAHITPKAARGAGLFVRLVYWLARRRLGRVPAPVGIMAYSGKVLAAAGAYELAAEHTRAIAPRLKALAELHAAMIVGCRFCVDIGSSMAVRHGVTADELRDLPRFADSHRFSPLERQVLEYAQRMTDTPMVVPRPLFDALQAALGVPALVELTAAIAWENHRARFNHAMGAQEEGYSTQMECLLPAARPQERPA